MRARPGRIDAVLPLSHDARGPAERRSVAYAERCGAVAEALERAMAKAGP